MVNAEHDDPLKPVNEPERIAESYGKRLSSGVIARHAAAFRYNHFARAERELKYSEILMRRFPSLHHIRMLEIGAGTGGNIFIFKQMGLSWDQIIVNELLPGRIACLKADFPSLMVLEGDAASLDLGTGGAFDIVLQSTVFTSILDKAFKMKLARNVWSVVRPGGIVLWYDFIYDNPANPDVKGIGRKEIAGLFREAADIRFHKVTLAPPIGRRIGRLYPFLNFPFLRTHLIAEIEK